MNSINFLKKALTDYRVGALTASSRYAVKAVIKNIKPGFKNIVEYGPGDGVITKAILDKLPADGRLTAIETNRDFCIQLRKGIKDHRFTLIEGSVADVCNDLKNNSGLSKIDAVISGIPFSHFKTSIREHIVKSTAEGIADGGAFIVYQYSLLLKPLLKKYFKKFSYKIELRNLPPYFVMVGKK